MTDAPKVSKRDPTNPSFIRHQGWLPYNVNRPPVIIVGCGAIGSHAAMLFAQLGFENFILFDGDVVESLNLANQRYVRDSVGLLKTDALEEELKRFSTCIQVEKRGLFTAETEIPSGFVVCGVDSFSARRLVLDRCVELEAAFCFTDFRLGFNFGRAYVVDMAHPLASDLIAEYKETIGNDADVTELPCTQKICPAPVQGLVAAGVQATVETIRYNEGGRNDADFAFPFFIMFDWSYGNINFRTFCKKV